MNIYSEDDERNIRVQRLLHDWNKSGLISDEQRDRMLPDVQVDLRRTNKFLRVTLFIFAMMILQAGAGLFALVLNLNDKVVVGVMALIASGASFAIAQWLITSYKLYRFGVEE